MNNNCREKIILFTQFYLAKDKETHELNIAALTNNYKNEYIDEIILLNEKIYSDEELGFENKNLDKIKQVNINKRLEYGDVFEYVQVNNLKNQIVVISNLDIYFNDTINNLNNVKLDEFKLCYCLTRWETYKDGKKHEPFLNHNTESSCDTWCLHTKWIHESDFSEFNFRLGTVGCENMFQYKLALSHFYLRNDPYLIKIFHSENYNWEEKNKKWNWRKIVEKSNTYVYNNNVPDEHQRELLRNYFNIACEIPVYSENNMSIGLVNINKDLTLYLKNFFEKLNCNVEIASIKGTPTKKDNTLPYDLESYAKYDRIIVCDNNSISLDWATVIFNKNNLLRKRTVIITPSLIRNYSNLYLYNLLFTKKYVVYNINIVSFEKFNTYCNELRENIGDLQYHICIISFGGCATTYILEECEKNNISINNKYDLDIKEYCKNFNDLLKFNLKIDEIKKELSLKNEYIKKICCGLNSVKHGNPYDDTYKYYDRIIYVVGNPFDALCSLYNRNYQKLQYNKLNNYINNNLDWDGKWNDFNILSKDIEKEEKDLFGFEEHYKFWINYATNKELSKSKIYFVDLEKLSKMNDDQLSLLFFNKIKKHNIKFIIKNRQFSSDSKISNSHNNNVIKNIYNNLYKEMKLALNIQHSNKYFQYKTPIYDLFFCTRYNPERFPLIDNKYKDHKNIPLYFRIFDIIHVTWKNIGGSVNRNSNKFNYVLIQPTEIKNLLEKVKSYISKNGDEFYKFKRILVIGSEDRPVLSEVDPNNLKLLKKYFNRILYESKDIIDNEIEIMPCGLLDHYIRGLDDHIFDIINNVNEEKKLRVLCCFGKFWKPDKNWYKEATKNREHLINYCSDNKNKFIDYDLFDREEYWRKLAEYSFFICPLGNGVTTPKIAEAICVNTIPICINHPAHVELRDKLNFPIVIVNNYDEINEKNLLKWKNELYEKVKKFKYKITTSAIHKLIMEGRESYISDNWLDNESYKIIDINTKQDIDKKDKEDKEDKEISEISKSINIGFNLVTKISNDIDLINLKDSIYSINENLKNNLFKKYLIFLEVRLNIHNKNLINTYLNKKDMLKGIIKDEFFTLLQNPKIEICIIEKNKSFKILFDFINKYHNINWILLNSNIYFPIWNINKLELLLNKNYDINSYVLTGYNIFNELSEKTKYSQQGKFLEYDNQVYKTLGKKGSIINSFIFKTPINIDKINLNFIKNDYYQRLNYELSRIRKLINPCLNVISIYKNSSEKIFSENKNDKKYLEISFSKIV